MKITLKELVEIVKSLKDSIDLTICYKEMLEQKDITKISFDVNDYLFTYFVPGSNDGFYIHISSRFYDYKKDKIELIDLVWLRNHLNYEDNIRIQSELQLKLKENNLIY